MGFWFRLPAWWWLVLGAAGPAWGQIRLDSFNYWVREDEGSLRIPVYRAGSLADPASVSYATTNITAKAGRDYVETKGHLSFGVGESVQWVSIPILNNGLTETNRTFSFGLGEPSDGVRLGSPRLTTVAVLDNDPGIEFVQPQVWVERREGAVTLTVVRGRDIPSEAFTVEFVTVAGTAQAGRDYVESRGTLVFAAESMTQTVSIPIVPTSAAAADRQFTVRLERPSGGLVLGVTQRASATVIITDMREMLPHRLERFRLGPGGLASFDLVGGYTPGRGVANRFLPDFDIIPIETSTNLMDWRSLTWVVRTNRDTNVLTWTDPQPADGVSRYYRTAEASFPAPQRPPTGPHAVGFFDRVLVDPERFNRYRIATNNTFPITVWYPAQRVAGRWPSEPYHPEAFARDPRPGAWEGEVDRAPHWKRYAIREAPFADGLGKAPVVIWSSGYLYSRFDVMEWAEHLASHGYIVVAADHRDASVVCYPDGSYVYFHYLDTLGRAVDTTLLNDRVRDTTQILDALESWQQSDAILAGKVDLVNVAAMGWSLGGNTVLELLRTDPRVKAAIALDAGTLNLAAMRSSRVAKPVLFINSDGNGDLQVFDTIATNAVQFQLRGATHDHLSTYYWDLKPTPSARGREAPRTLVDYSVWFADRHLKGSQRPMPEVAQYPKLYGLRQK